MDINDYIRPDLEYDLIKVNMVFDKIKELMTLSANESNAEKRQKLSEEIQSYASIISRMAIRQEKKNGKEKIDLFMEKYKCKGRKEHETHCNAHIILDMLLSDILHDVDDRKAHIARLQQELKTASLEQKFVTEIMNEVYAKLKEISDAMIAVIPKTVIDEGSIDLFRAEIAIGYLSLVPDCAKEIDALKKELIAISPRYKDLTEKYK
jgi:hypothetical protein